MTAKIMKLVLGKNILHVLNTAVHVITTTQKFDCDLGHILHDELHWLDIPGRCFFKLAVTVHRV